MTGLREKKKADRKNAIIHAAISHFKHVGYEDARIETIAKASDLSVGTLYKYFKTKADLLLAIVTLEVEEALIRGEAIIDAPHNTGLDAFFQLIKNYYDSSLYFLSKEMWRAAYAISLQRPHSTYSVHWRNLEVALVNQIKNLVERLQAASILQSFFDPQVLGEMIFYNMNGLFFSFTSNDSMSIEDLNSRFHTHLSSLLNSPMQRVTAGQV